MKFHALATLRTTAIAVALCICAATTFGQDSIEAAAVFRDAGSLPADGPTVMRARSVVVALDELNRTPEGGSLSFDLFGDRHLGQVIRRRQRSAQRFTLSGELGDAEPGGTFVLAVNDTAVAATIRLHDGSVYRVRGGAGNLHRLEQLDPAQIGLDDCVAPGGQRGLDPAAPGGGVAGDCDDGSRIDVLVVYTEEAAGDAGGTADMEAAIDVMIEDNNVAYANSLVETEMHLVYAWQLDLPQSDVSLGALTNPDDGIMDGVHDLRDAYGADQVALIRSGGGGVANGLWNLEPESEALAFCLNGLDSAPNMVLAHELGHNMGCCHALGDGGGCPGEGGLLYPYSNGHRWIGDSRVQWRTVMAYSPGTLTLHVSNPGVLFDGQPTGTSPAGEDPGADNALTINNSKLAVSNWRCNDGICEGLDLPSDAPDCNDNDIPDQCEVALGLADDVNNNDVPDACECVGDTNGDNQVDVDDLVAVITDWAETDSTADVNGDGAVDVDDLVMVIQQWGRCKS